MRLNAFEAEKHQRERLIFLYLLEFFPKNVSPRINAVIETAPSAVLFFSAFAANF